MSYCDFILLLLCVLTIYSINSLSLCFLYLSTSDRGIFNASVIRWPHLENGTTSFPVDGWIQLG